MFKIVGKLKNNKKGFTLVELLVTVAIFSLITMLTLQMWTSIYDKYQQVEKRYIVQTELEYIVKSFQADASTGSLFTATNVDMYYEDMDKAQEDKLFVTCPELGTFTENEETGVLTFDNRPADSINTYLFCYNDYFYVLNSKQKNAYRFVMSDDTHVNIEFSVAIDAFEIDPSTKKESESAVDEDGDPLEHKYLPTGITVKVSSGKQFLPEVYSLDTSFALANLKDGFQVNMNSVNGGYLTNGNVAGWTNGIIKNYPDVTKFEPGVSYPNMGEAATIVKYISLVDYMDGAITGNDPNSTTTFGCATRWLMADSDVGGGVVDTLRDFRDNVLKGNKLGEKIIEKYYELSPKIIEFASENPTAKKILTEAVTDVAYVIDISKE